MLPFFRRYDNCIQTGPILQFLGDSLRFGGGASPLDPLPPSLGPLPHPPPRPSDTLPPLPPTP